MAEASVSWAEDQFCCPVCLDVLKDPVTIPCGHSYCMSCITGCWNPQDQKGFYSCPQCRKTFTPRPALAKNVVVAEMVEKLKKTKIQAAVPAHCTAEPGNAGTGDVECDVCTGIKHKAVKSCLVCLNSYCQNHLEQHENFFKGKRHNLIDATGRLQERICPQHDKMLEMFCRTDQQCVCMMCMVDTHRNHDAVSAAAERAEKQKHVGVTKGIFQQKIQEREKDLQELREAVESHKRSARTAVEDSERVFTDLIRSIERSRSEVIRLIRDQESAEVSRAESRLKRVEQEIADLRRRHAELEQISHTDDHIHFLQSFQSLYPSGSSDRFTISPLLSFQDVWQSLSQLREKVEHFCREEIEMISSRVKTIQVISGPEYQTRQEFLQFSRPFTLDLNTVNNFLRLSEGNRVIACTPTFQLYSEHPERFDRWPQVLCRERVCGRCYWEVECSGGVHVSLSYKTISRKGGDEKCVFGCNSNSWRFTHSPSGSSFWHNDVETKLPAVSRSSRIGVYVDLSAGILSFYSVSDTMTLIHRVQTTFTQPVFPAFGLDNHSTVKLCQ